MRAFGLLGDLATLLLAAREHKIHIRVFIHIHAIWSHPIQDTLWRRGALAELVDGLLTSLGTAFAPPSSTVQGVWKLLYDIVLTEFGRCPQNMSDFATICRKCTGSFCIIFVF